VPELHPTAVPRRRGRLRTPRLGIASHWPFESWRRFLPEPSAAVSLLGRLLHHASVVVTDGDSYRMRQARTKGGTTLNETGSTPEGWGLQYWPG
jgi:hypothetical protein